LNNVNDFAKRTQLACIHRDGCAASAPFGHVASLHRIP